MEYAKAFEDRRRFLTEKLALAEARALKDNLADAVKWTDHSEFLLSEVLAFRKKIAVQTERREAEREARRRVLADEMAQMRSKAEKLSDPQWGQRVEGMTAVFKDSTEQSFVLGRSSDQLAAVIVNVTGDLLTASLLEGFICKNSLDGLLNILEGLLGQLFSLIPGSEIVEIAMIIVEGIEHGVRSMKSADGYLAELERYVDGLATWCDGALKMLSAYAGLLDLEESEVEDV